MRHAHTPQSTRFRFVWNEAGERRSMTVRVNDCEYQSFIANVRWIVGARWQEIGCEIKK